MKKTTQLLTLVIFSFILSGCKKESKTDPVDEPIVSNPATPANTDNYSSLDDFYNQNGVKVQTFTFNPAEDAKFVTAQATTINIPHSTFQFGSGVVTLEFKEIYKKSDMLLSDMGTDMLNDTLLKSSGEFFIKALNNNLAVQPIPSMSVQIMLPFNEPVDNEMAAFVGQNDGSGGIGWQEDPNNDLFVNVSNYVFSLYTFSSPLDSGTWCNSDDPTYFLSFNQTVLTIQPEQTAFLCDVFLVFKNVNSMVHIDKHWLEDKYPYHYAPLGQECTVVAISVKDGKLYSSFTPITIGIYQTVKFKLTETTTDAFKTALKKLDN